MDDSTRAPIPVLLPAGRVPTGSGAGIPAPRQPVDLRLDTNQGRAPGPAFWREVAACESEPELLSGYPLDHALERTLAAHFGVRPEQVLVAAGADDVLDRLCRAVLEPGRELVLPVPTFEMLERHATLTGAKVMRVPWPDGALPLQQMLAQVTARTAMLAVVSPNNPTGLVASAGDLRELAARAPHALLLFDHVYAEFADADLTATALTLPNCVVVRSFSKAWGLAGLRLGYALGPEATIRWLRSVGSPFTAGRFARHLGLRRWHTGTAELRDYVATATRERAELTALLQELGHAPLPSQGNFVFARAREPLWLRDALLGLGIAVRAFAFGGVAADGVRITVPGDAAAFARLERALRVVSRPQAIVLDLDGVLADIEGRKPLVDAAVVAALAERLPLAVVTSCPRRLAESVLARHGFLPHVRAVIGDEDAPAKPDPAPIWLALQRLGCERAWMLGDNPADIEAARAAGVVPLAIAPRGIGAEAHAARLFSAGAARLLASPDELLPLLTR